MAGKQWIQINAHIVKDLDPDLPDPDLPLKKVQNPKYWLLGLWKENMRYNFPVKRNILINRFFIRLNSFETYIYIIFEEGCLNVSQLSFTRLYNIFNYSSTFTLCKSEEGNITKNFCYFIMKTNFLNYFKITKDRTKPSIVIWWINLKSLFLLTYQWCWEIK